MNILQISVFNMQERENYRPKELKEQVLVVTGASNPIGRHTATVAASLGARVVVVSRDESALQDLNDEIARSGGSAMSVVADVGKEEDVARIARSAIRTYGTFDTWINTAGITLYGECLEVPPGDMRRLMDTNFWGVVYGSRAAVHHFRQTGQYGSIISIGSFPSDNPEALQPLYTIASQAAISWLGALRVESKQEMIPVSISIVHPGQSETAGDRRRRVRRRHATNVPLWSAEKVAETILHCAVAPRDEVYVESRSRLASVLQGISPSFAGGFSNVPGMQPVSDDAETFIQQPSQRLSGLRPGKAVVSANRQYPPGGKKRTLLSSIVLAGLGAGMWLLSRPKK